MWIEGFQSHRTENVWTLSVKLHGIVIVEGVCDSECRFQWVETLVSRYVKVSMLPADVDMTISPVELLLSSMHSRPGIDFVTRPITGS
jgi:hypothetical protein